MRQFQAGYILDAVRNELGVFKQSTQFNLELWDGPV